MNFLVTKTKQSAGISAESAAKARSEISITRRYFADMLILMVVPAVMAWYYYGGRAVRLMVLSVLTAVLCEAAGSFISKLKPLFPISRLSPRAL